MRGDARRVTPRDRRHPPARNIHECARTTRVVGEYGTVAEPLRHIPWCCRQSWCSPSTAATGLA